MSIETERTPAGDLSAAAVHDAEGNARAEGTIDPPRGGRSATFSWWMNLASHEFSGELGHDCSRAMEMLASEVDRLNELAGITEPSAKLEQRVKVTGALWLAVIDERRQIVFVSEAGDSADVEWAPNPGVSRLSAGALWQMERACRDLRQHLSAFKAARADRERRRATSFEN